MQLRYEATAGRFDRDEVLSRVDLPALVEGYSGPGRVSGALREFRCPHPAHVDVHPSFHVNRKDGTWLFACRSQCQKYGNAIDFLMWIEGVEFPEALRMLAEMAGVAPTTEWTPRCKPSAPIQPAPWRPPVDTSTPITGDEATVILIAFCEARGVRVQTALDLGLSVVDDQGRPRVRFPFFVAGQLAWWQDRAAWAGASKAERWRSPCGASSVPFGVDRMVLLDEYGECVHDDDPQQDLWVVEGPSDALALIDACPEAVVLGLPGGAFPSLARWVVASAVGLELFAVVDNDEAGMSYRAHLATACFEHGVVLHHVYVPEAYNDVGDWWLAAGDDFREQLVVAIMAALSAEGRL